MRIGINIGNNFQITSKPFPKIQSALSWYRDIQHRLSLFSVSSNSIWELFNCAFIIQNLNLRFVALQHFYWVTSDFFISTTFLHVCFDLKFPQHIPSQPPLTRVSKRTNASNECVLFRCALLFAIFGGVICQSHLALATRNLFSASVANRAYASCLRSEDSPVS